MALAEAYDSQNGHSVSDLAGYSLRGLMRELTPPQKRGGHTAPAIKPKQKLKRAAPYDELVTLWLDVPEEERKNVLKRFLDAVGLRAVRESVPDSWKEVLRREPLT
jgi:hypothetical protein